MQSPVGRTVVLHLAFATALSLPMLGCGSSNSAVDRAATSADLNASDAERIVDAYRRRREIESESDSNNPLRQPKSLDDVLEILRLDEIALYPGAVRFAQADGTPRGKVLAAQIFIAWGDAQHMLGEELQRATRDLNRVRDRLEKRKAAGKIKPADEARLGRIEKSLADVQGVEHALRHVGNAHIREGMALAEKVIASSPNDYEGYRVAADYYRLREDWKNFDDMVAKIDALHSQSNGLVFLRAQAARDRDHNVIEASKLLHEALQNDPKFTRAEVALLALQPEIAGAYAELQKLKKINPHHQVVVWLGPTLEHNYQDWQETEDRHDFERDIREPPGTRVP